MENLTQYRNFTGADMAQIASIQLQNEGPVGSEVAKDPLNRTVRRRQCDTLSETCGADLPGLADRLKAVVLER